MKLFKIIDELCIQQKVNLEVPQLKPNLMKTIFFRMISSNDPKEEYCRVTLHIILIHLQNSKAQKMNSGITAIPKKRTSLFGREKKK